MLLTWPVPDTTQASGHNAAIHIWRVETGQCCWELKGHNGTGALNCVVYTSLEASAHKSMARTRIASWQSPLGKQSQSSQEPESEPEPEPEARRVRTAGEETSIRLWSIPTVTLDLFSSRLHAPMESRAKTGLWEILCHPDIANGMTEEHTPGCELLDHEAPVLGCCVSPTGHRAVSFSSDGCCRLWDLQNQRRLRTVYTQSPMEESSPVILYPRSAILRCKGSVDARGDSPEGDCNTASLYVWDLLSGKLHELSHEGRSHGLEECVSVDDQRLLSWNDAGYAYIWKATPPQ